MNMFLVSESPALHKNVVNKLTFLSILASFHDLCTFVAKFCCWDLRTFSAKYFGLGSRLRKLFRFLDVCLFFTFFGHNKGFCHFPMFLDTFRIQWPPPPHPRFIQCRSVPPVCDVFAPQRILSFSCFKILSIFSEALAIFWVDRCPTSDTFFS